MKTIRHLALAVLFASSAAHAVDVTNSFNVSVAFTGACQVSTAASNLAFTYAAFGAADSKSTSTVFKCSRGLNPTFKFDDTDVNQTGSAAANLGAAITGEGLISGIRYTLTGSSARSTSGVAAAAGAAGTGGKDGTADEYTVNITAAIAGNQAGNGASGSGTHVRVLTISY